MNGKRRISTRPRRLTVGWNDWRPRCRAEGRHIMNRTVLTILYLGSCLFTQPLIAPAASAQATRAKSTINITDLFQHWVHSREEEQPGGAIQIFRPAMSMEFPPSRFRMAYKFARDGGCEYFALSPDDAHHFQSCRWRMSANKTTLQIVANRQSTSYRIVELSKTILRLVPLVPRRGK